MRIVTSILIVFLILIFFMYVFGVDLMSFSVEGLVNKLSNAPEIKVDVKIPTIESDWGNPIFNGFRDLINGFMSVLNIVLMFVSFISTLASYVFWLVSTFFGYVFQGVL